MFERIVVALDGSEDARAAGSLALRLAARLGSRVSAVYVVDARLVEGPAVETLAPLWGEVSSRPFRAEVMDAWRERGSRVLDEFCAEAGGEECGGIERWLEVGIAEEVILEKAAAADLVVMGRRGENAAFGDHPVGSTLGRVLRRAPHPVLVTRDGGGGSSPGGIPRRGLVAYDGREPAVRALDLAIRWSRAVDGEVRLLVAGDEASDALLETGGRVLHDHGIAWEGARLDADPADAVVEAIERWETDALFMGAYGRGRLRDFVLGSHTEAILGAAGLPVFLTR